MKKIFLIFFFGFALNHVSCQIQSRYPILPTSIWRVDSLDAVSRIFERMKLFVNGDTSINGLQYHKIFKSGIAYYNVPFYYKNVYLGALRDTDNKIFYIKKSRTTEAFLYDFNLKTGDTIKASIARGKVILSIDTLPDGRKIFNYDIGHYTRAFIIEGIGTNGGLFSGGIAYIPMHSGESACYLICYAENEDLVYQSDLHFNTNCEIINRNGEYKIEPSGKWRYDIDIDSDTLVYYERYQYYISGDTTIKSNNYYKFYKKFNKLTQIDEGTYNIEINKILYLGAIRDTENKYYFIPDGLASEELLYDFDLLKGDTNKAVIFKGESVYDIDTVLDNRKEIYLGNDYWNKIIYAGIGSTRDFLDEHKTNAYLKCYSENDVPIIHVPGVTDCELNINDASFPVCNNIYIIPNYLFEEKDKSVKISFCYPIPSESGILPVLSGYNLIKDGNIYKLNMFYNDENPLNPGQSLISKVITDTIPIGKLGLGYHTINLSVNFIHTAEGNDTTFNFFAFNHEFFIYEIVSALKTKAANSYIKISPVPARNKIVLESPDSFNKIKAVEIYNLLGEKVLVKNLMYSGLVNNLVIDVSFLKPGVYLLNVIGHNLSVNQKIIIY